MDPRTIAGRHPRSRRRMSRGRPTGSVVRRLSLLVLAAVLLTACAGDDALDASFPAEPSADFPMDMPASEDMAMDDGAWDVDAERAEAGMAPVADLPIAAEADPRADRQVIRTAQLSLQVRDGAEVAAEAERLATDAGGYLAGSDLRRETDGTVRGTLILRVPNEALVAVVDALDDLAEAVPLRRIDEQDVTTELTDIEARLVNLRAYEDELRTLLSEVRGEGSDTGPLLAVFEQLNQVRLDIETTEARQLMLRDRVSLSTITVEIQPARGAVPVTDPTWQPTETFRDAVASLLRALESIVDALIWTVVTVLPVLLLIGLLLLAPILLLRAWFRRRRARRPLPPPSPVTPGQGPPSGSPGDWSTAPPPSWGAPPAGTPTAVADGDPPAGSPHDGPVTPASADASGDAAAAPDDRPAPGP